MKLLAGTSGFSYPEWKGVFYPEDLPNKELLRYYSGKLPAVEINNTFYRMPQEHLLTGWAGQVPPGFKFVLKASRKITHFRPLQDKRDEVDYLCRTAAVLGERLGAILFQLPPSLHSNQDLLANFLEALPPGSKAAFEFRHRSWFAEETYALLSSKDAALCCAEDKEEDLCQLVATASWGYLRLRKPGYTRQELTAWRQRIAAQPWQQVFVFFKHEEAGTGPLLAQSLLELPAPSAC